MGNIPGSGHRNLPVTYFCMQGSAGASQPVFSPQNSPMAFGEKKFMDTPAAVQQTYVPSDVRENIKIDNPFKNTAFKNDDVSFAAPFSSPQNTSAPQANSASGLSQPLETKTTRGADSYRQVRKEWKSAETFRKTPNTSGIFDNASNSANSNANTFGSSMQGSTSQSSYSENFEPDVQRNQYNATANKPPPYFGAVAQAASRYAARPVRREFNSTIGRASNNTSYQRTEYATNRRDYDNYSSHGDSWQRDENNNTYNRRFQGSPSWNQRNGGFIPGENMQKPDWKNSNLTPFRKNFYKPHPNTDNRPQEELKKFYDTYEIKVTGNAPKPILRFDEANFPDYVSKTLGQIGFDNPTPIQSVGWPIAMSGLNMVGVAQTGSGKTLGKMPHTTELPTSKFKQIPSIEVWKNMTVEQLANTMGKSCDHVFETMMYVEDSNRYDRPQAVINDWKVIQDVVKKSGYRPKVVSPPDKEKDEEQIEDVTNRPPATEDQLRPRPPVITIMGHVDHGKTTLLDTLRKSSIVKSEFGGITQHIGAFSVVLKTGERITMLDTPGHAAFSAMRARGAQATDIVVLVVAADDGVKEQTVESVRMAQEAEVPIIVAINKIDKPGADIERTKRMLLQLGLTLEGSGGDIQTVPISALKGTNVDDLVEAIALQAEVMEIKADYDGPVEGTIIESKMDHFRGKLATVLVTRGTLTRGKVVVAGLAWGKVRSMFDEAQKVVQKVTPGMATQMIGWRMLPSAGDVLLEVESETRAAKVIKWREENKMKEKSEQDLEVIQSKMAEHDEVYKAQLEERRKLGRRRLKPTGPRRKEFEDDNEIRVSILVKGDVDGSVEAILDLLDTYNSTLCKLELVHYGVGNVSQSDVELAGAFQAIIYTFNTGVLREAEDIARSKKVPIRKHNVIYKLFDDIKKEIEKKLPLIEEEERLGEANVLEQFLINEGRRKIPVAGCRCVKGVLKRNAYFRVERNGNVIYDGKLDSMRHLKNEVDSISSNIECGLRLADKNIEVRPGDTIICYIKPQHQQKLDWDLGF